MTRLVVAVAMLQALTFLAVVVGTIAGVRRADRERDAAVDDEYAALIEADS